MKWLRSLAKDSVEERIDQPRAIDTSYALMDVIQPVLAIYRRPPLLLYHGPLWLQDGAIEDSSDEDIEYEDESDCSGTIFSTDGEDNYAQVVVGQEGNQVRVSSADYEILQEGRL